MPAVTVAGALALAGCGGGSSTPVTTDTRTVGTTTLTIQPGATSHHAGYNYTCDKDRTAACVITITNGVIQTGAAGVTREMAKAPSTTTQEGLTASALLLSNGFLHEASAEADQAAFLKAKTGGDLIFGDSINAGEKWYDALDATERELTVKGQKSETYALSATGKKVSAFGSVTITSAENGQTVGSAAYKGITGTLVCNGTSCGKTEGDEPTLTGGWYFFAAAGDTNDYVKGDDGNYVLRSTQTNADWGIWLNTTAATNSAPAVSEITQRINVAQVGDILTDVDDNAPSGFNTATYEGDAGGVSTLYKKGETAATVGEFTATAELTATFSDASPMLKGRIFGFDGDAVNRNWELTLADTALSSGTVTAGTTRIGEIAGPTGSSWEAHLYAKRAGTRPDGVVGGFDGRFTDGQAVGVFHATPE